MTFKTSAAAAFGIALAAAATAAAPSAALAGTTTCTITSNPDVGLRKLATFDGSASYDSDAKKLTVTIRNSSKRGVLTGFAFSADQLGAVTYADGDVLTTKRDEDRFDDLCRKGAKKAKPFGKYNAGAALYGHWNAKPAKGRGVAVGDTRTFTFDVTSADASSLTVADLLGGYDEPTAFVAAFRGVKPMGKNDRVAAVMAAVTYDTGGNGTGGTTTDPVGPGTDNPGTNLEESPTGSNNNPGTNNPGTNNPGNGHPAAVPLPPAAVPGILTLGALGLASVRRRLTGLFA